MIKENTPDLKWHGYLMLIIIMFMIFMFDFVNYYVWLSAAEQYQWLPLTNKIIGHTATILVWGFGSGIVLMALKRKWKIDLFAVKPTPAKTGIALSTLCLIIMTIVMTIANGGIKPLLEYQSAIRRLGSLGWIDFILQNIYYALEMLVALLMCVFGQEAGELLTAMKRIPWGGIVLGMLWGLPHIVSKNVAVGIMSIVIGLVLGLPYILLSKNAKLAWLFMFLMFVL